MKILAIALPVAVFSLSLSALPALAAPPPPGPMSTTNSDQIHQDTAISLGVTADGSNAFITGNVAKSAAGDIGFNVTSGIGNKQANSTIVQGPTSTLADLKSSTNQSIELTGGGIFGEDNTQASINGNVAKNASGNIGMNVASGTFNEQANSLQVSAAALAGATAKTSQTSCLLGGVTTSDLTASISGNAFANASGRIGANVASGVGNAQSNTLVVQN